MVPQHEVIFHYVGYDKKLIGKLSITRYVLKALEILKEAIF
jgi:hypothetical protein